MVKCSECTLSQRQNPGNSKVCSRYILRRGQQGLLYQGLAGNTSISNNMRAVAGERMQVGLDETGALLNT